MFQDKRVLAIIPARGGSKRVPRKNIKDLGGQPLIAYTIRAAQQCPLIDRLVVSTDDEEIAAVARQWGVDVPFLRPKELALDASLDQPVAVHVIETLKEKGEAYDYVLWLRPTTPFKTALDIEQALERIQVSQADLVRSVTLAGGGFHPYWTYKTEDGFLKPMMDIRPEDYPRSQLLPKNYFHLNGVVDVFQTEHVLKSPYLYSSSRMGFIEIPANRAIDIDEPHDFFQAEAMLRSQQAENENQAFFAQKVTLGSLAVSSQDPVFLIAEAGVNHNGDLEIAYRLISEAKKAGAHAVKFQSFTADSLVSKGTPKVRHHVDPQHPEETHYDMIKYLEIDHDFQRRLFERCAEEGIMFLSTPYDVESARFLNELGVAAFKTASADIVDLPLHEFIAQTKKPAFVSVGMASLEEIQTVIDIYRHVQNPHLILLHCTSSYPASAHSLNLRVIPVLREHFGVLVGYSDHSVGNQAAMASTSLGACVVEKHFTLDKKMDGPDHKASIEPAELAGLAQDLQHACLILGDGIKATTPEEMDMKQFSRKSLVSARPIAKGEVIGDQDVVLKRPGTGYSWEERVKVIGKIAIRPIAVDCVICPEDLQQQIEA